MDMMSYLMGRSAGSKNAKTQVVTELPETGEPNVIYLVPKQTAGQDDIFDEYIWVNEDWELIGSTAIDISGKQDTMQFSTMPTADSTTVGKIIQYTGTTDANYTNGYFYIGTSTTEDNETTYGWTRIDLQPAPDMSLYATKDYATGVRNTVCVIRERLHNLCATYAYTLNTSFFSEAIDTINNTLQSTNDLDSPWSKFTLVYIEDLNHNIMMIPLTVERNSYNYDITGTGNTDVTATIFSADGNSHYTRMRTMTWTITWDGALHKVTGLELKAKTTSFSEYAKNGDVLTKTNTNSYTPTDAFHPTTKYYVDTRLYVKSGIPSYLTNTTYNEGDYVWHSSTGSTNETNLYVCNTDGTTGNWDSTKWTQKNYVEYLNDVLIGSALGGSY